ncbi:MAG: glycine cleavage system aminomethyltransferase GcvT [Deltaproteobacteria bacterium]|nr:glycine cleavage system aminomethyltransferase GcvT [Deltaproteobacteria bacterium]
MSERLTPLYELHKELGGKLVPFAGWQLPVRYQSAKEEHEAVRSAAGLFDVSHMGEIWVTGAEAEKALNFLTCNDVTKLSDGKALYSAILNERGGVVDDIIIYRFSLDRFLICVNASNSEKDYEWLQSKNRFEAEFVNESDRWGQIALQGPKSASIVASLPGGEVIAALKRFRFFEAELGGIKIIAARTGYTGEDGFEFFTAWGETADLWSALLNAGKDFGLVPCGLAARDSLRLEACYPLHGHELSEDYTAFESGLAWIVKLDKGDFIGRSALLAENERGSIRKLTPFFVEDAGIVREGAAVFSTAGDPIGVVTSGTHTPTVNRALGLAMVKSEYSKEGAVFEAEVRGKRLQCKAASSPFYDATKSK